MKEQPVLCITAQGIIENNTGYGFISYDEITDFYFLDNSKLYIYDIERETCEELLSDTSGISLNSSGIKVLNENGNMVCCVFNNVYIFTPLNYENDRIAVNVAYFEEISCVPFDENVHDQLFFLNKESHVENHEHPCS